MELTKYKICPDCGKQNPPGLFECQYCEADLTGVMVVDRKYEEDVVDLDDTATTSIETELVRICECGTENAPQARKCKSCGEDISDIIPVQTEKKTEKSFSYELTSPDGLFSVTIDKPLMEIGRESDLNDYLQSKVYVSRKHARLTILERKVFIENLSRTNKTFLNNVDIPDGTPSELQDGDEIGLGGKVIDGNRQDKAAYFIFKANS